MQLWEWILVNEDITKKKQQHGNCFHDMQQSEFFVFVWMIDNHTLYESMSQLESIFQVLIE